MKAVILQPLYPLMALLSQLMPPDDILLRTGAADISIADTDVIFLPQESLPEALALRRAGYDGEIVFAGARDSIPPELLCARPVAHISLPADISAVRSAFDRCVAYLRHPDRVYALPSRDGTRFISHEDILYFGSSGHHALIHTTLQREPLSHLRKLDDISDCFAGGRYVRCHQRYLVNLAHVVLLDRANSMLELDDGSRVPVSKRFYGSTVDAVHAYCLRN